MIRLTDQQIADLIRLYQEHFGIELTKEEARQRGERLVELIRLIHKRTPIEPAEVISE